MRQWVDSVIHERRKWFLHLTWTAYMRRPTTITCSCANPAHIGGYTEIDCGSFEPSRENPN
jgi:hypothetical protein